MPNNKNDSGISKHEKKLAHVYDIFNCILQKDADAIRAYTAGDEDEVYLKRERHQLTAQLRNNMKKCNLPDDEKQRIQEELKKSHDKLKCTVKATIAEGRPAAALRTSTRNQVVGIEVSTSRLSALAQELEAAKNDRDEFFKRKRKLAIEFTAFFPDIFYSDFKKLSFAQSIMDAFSNYRGHLSTNAPGQVAMRKVANLVSLFKVMAETEKSNPVAIDDRDLSSLLDQDQTYTPQQDGLAMREAVQSAVLPEGSLDKSSQYSPYR